ncbi:rRNA-binding ribosome biosynthesis protein utp25 [Ceratobasidium sp. 392]|nr:rRNA-binding ribosome biosynthesis protein utp25 [Ceratobasidium sp. 392]
MPAQDPATVKLLTLLNVSSLKSRRRSLKLEQASTEGQPAGDEPKRRKLGGRLAVPAAAQNGDEESQEDTEEESDPDEIEGEDGRLTSNEDTYNIHFGTSKDSTPMILTPSSRAAIDSRKLHHRRQNLGTGPEQLGSMVESVVETVEQTECPATLPSLLSSYRDVMLPYVGTSPKEHDTARRKVCDHIVEHLQKHRKQIMSNNARLLAHSKATAAATEAAKSSGSKPAITDPPTDVRDQGFTRPTVLILLPFRNSALALVDTLIVALNDSREGEPPKTENYARLQSEYGLPPGVEDKLLSAEPGAYPSDHVRNFAGNTDDAFRLGIRLSNKGKGWRLFSGFLGSDIIIASPLGLRMGIEREGPPDFLSSLDIILIDQLDGLVMQNWTHLTHILELCNVLPKEAHGADFARVREWCLDGHSAYLRQTIMLSAFETPQIRALFNNIKLLKNVAGRVRQTRRYGPVAIPEGIVVNWTKLDCDEALKEVDSRFEYFKTKLVPDILSTSRAQTLIFVPSYFDYLRVYNHLVATAPSSVAGISEYSTNQDISRARQAFFKGTKPVLVITERFYFFRRYKLRAIKHLTFYAPPDHAQFFTELLSFPFLDNDETPVSPGEVQVTGLFSKFDYMRLERIEGTKEAAAMCAPISE